MALLDWETGALCFSDGLELRPNMPASALSERLSGAERALWRSDMLAVAGGCLSAVCAVEDGVLARVSLEVSQTGGKLCPGAEKQRAFLFACLRLKDPCPDTRGCVRVRRGFGQVVLSSDPHTGRAAAVVIYSSGSEP